MVRGIQRRKRFKQTHQQSKIPQILDEKFTEDFEIQTTAKSLDPQFDLTCVPIPGGDLGFEGFPALGSGAGGSIDDAPKLIKTPPSVPPVPLSPRVPHTRMSATGSVAT